MKLYQLPNGDWVDPERITGVKALESSYSDASGTWHRNRVVVYWNSGMVSIFEFETLEEAQAARDKIGQEINELRK